MSERNPTHLGTVLISQDLCAHDAQRDAYNTHTHTHTQIRTRTRTRTRTLTRTPVMAMPTTSRFMRPRGMHCI